MRWSFIDTGFNSGTFNMEFDGMLARRAEDEPGSAVLRVYGWNPPAVSIGVHQDENDFDALALKREGIDLVRRPTGGRAILHSHELTYSVVMPVEELGPRETYRFVGRCILRALSVLGIAATVSERDRGLGTDPHDPASVPCFSATARDEIQFEGRKLVGSAQRRFGRIVLQHGSILLGPQHRRIAEFLSPSAGRSRPLIEEDLLNRTTDAETILGRGVSYEECARAMRRGFELASGIRFEAQESGVPEIQPA
jgi:lipoate-protein ligase A